MTSQRGFTLIEALAAGAISTIVAGACLAIFSMTTGQIRESAANTNLGQIQSVVSEQIRRDARFAYGPKAEWEDMGALFTDPIEDDAAIPGLKSIYFCDRNGSPFSAYRIRDGHLEEWNAAQEFVPFKIGDLPVAVDGDNSKFDILAGRAGVTFQIASLYVSDKVYAFPLIPESVLSRNN